MSPQTPADPFTEWEAAYVLGALSADERAAFEEHLSQCGPCRRAVGELAGVPGLLSVVPAGDALGLIGPVGTDAVGTVTPTSGRAEEISPGRPSGDPIGETPSHDLVRSPSPGSHEPATGQTPATSPIAEGSGQELSALIARVRRSRRRRRIGAVGTVAVGIAAVFVFMLAVVVPGLRPDTRELDVTLSPVTETSLTATAHLSATADGTQISTTCNYGQPGSTDAEYADRSSAGTFGLFVTTADGTVRQVATWAAGPGETVHAAGHTEVDFDRIESVQIAPADRSVVLLRAAIDP